MQHILIVEDDLDIQDLLRNFLQEVGYEITIASDGMEAIALFSSAHFDLILLDIMLPKIDGFTVCELIRKQSQVPSYMRIINNLIQNVIAHSHANKIKIALSKKENNMELLLADNGVGIEKEDLKHIFERLYKCDKGRSEKGSGLGLSIVHQLVEKMGGSITVESVPGKGTEFMLLFPLEI